MNYTDPSGHCVWDLCIGEGTILYLGGAALLGFGLAVTPQVREASRRLVSAADNGLTWLGDWLHKEADALADSTAVFSQRLTSNWEWVAKKLGISKKGASQSIHDAKGRTGRGGADNIKVDPETGDIYAPESDEPIGNLGDYEPGD